MAISFLPVRFIPLAMLATLAWGGEAADGPRSLAAIATAAAKPAGADGVPDWLKDPTCGGELMDSATGSGTDVGWAMVSALREVIAVRSFRRQAQAKEAALAAGKAPPPAAAQGDDAIGEFRVQSILRNFVKEAEAGGKASTHVEEIVRVVHPQFTIKRFVAESGEITAKDSSTQAIQRVEWTAKGPTSGAQVAKALAASGVVLAARASLGSPPESHLWLVLLPTPVPPVEGEGYLLPLQAPAVAVAQELKSSGLDNLLGAQVDRVAADTVRITWPQSASELTLTLDRDGAVVALKAQEVITGTSRPLAELIRESLTATAGPVQVQRLPAGEVWRVKR